jgi:hypothetical protein
MSNIEAGDDLEHERRHEKKNVANSWNNHTFSA